MINEDDLLIKPWTVVDTKRREGRRESIRLAYHIPQELAGDGTREGKML
jgi:hypothetical protein